MALSSFGPFRNADEILPGLWLGNRGAALDAEFLTKNRIRAVFNCTKDIEFSLAPVVAARYRIPVDDNLQADEIRNLGLWADEIVYKIMKEHKQGPVLVHCMAGMQRSAACVAMVLVATRHLTTDQAIAAVREKRGIAFRPMANFKEAIQTFERYCERTIWPALKTQQSL